MNETNKTDVLLIQPSTLFRKKKIHPTVKDYFNSLTTAGGLIGDNPLEPNYGLLSLATSLRGADLSVKIIDFNQVDWELRNQNKLLDSELIYKTLSEHTPQIIGISYMTTSYAIWEEQLRSIIRSIPHLHSIPIIYGGIQPSLMDKDLIPSDKNLFVLRGEGEYLFTDLCKSYLKNKSKLFYKKQIIEANILDPSLLADLNLPDYSMWPSHQTERRFYSTRGCSGVCAFCSARSIVKTHGKSFLRPMCSDENGRFDLLIDEMYLEKKQGNKIIIGDLTFFSDQTYSSSFCKKIYEKQDVYKDSLDFWCQTRSDCVTLESVSLLASAGAKQVAIGGETTKSSSLKRLRKGVTFNDTIRALNILKKFNLETQLYMIIGAGGESGHDVEKNIEEIVSLLNNGLVDLVHLSIMVPFIGTDLYRNPQKFGINIIDYDYKNYWMNCDLYGYGFPVYETIDSSGKILLTQNEIYDFWIIALNEILKIYKKKKLRIVGSPTYYINKNISTYN